MKIICKRCPKHCTFYQLEEAEKKEDCEKAEKEGEYVVIPI
ncbi:MAG: hypothetical protein ACOCP8_02620 [archaeon]